MTGNKLCMPPRATHTRQIKNSCKNSCFLSVFFTFVWRCTLLYARNHRPSRQRNHACDIPLCTYTYAREPPRMLHSHQRVVHRAWFSVMGQRVNERAFLRDSFVSLPPVAQDVARENVPPDFATTTTMMMMIIIMMMMMMMMMMMTMTTTMTMAMTMTATVTRGSRSDSHYAIVAVTAVAVIVLDGRKERS